MTALARPLLTKSGRTNSTVLIIIALMVLTIAVYLQAGNHQFLNFDDNVYVTANPHVAGGITGQNLAWAFTSVDAGNWHPLTWLSHMTDVQLFGMDPRGHHLVNVALHTLSTLLLFLLLLRLTGKLWQSAFVAALFALHPLHVESVAWVAERKDVLSTLFWFLTLFLYAEYAEKRKPLLYLFSLCFFVLGLMAKSMLVTLPVVMLLLDFWPLGRYRCEKQNPGLRQQLRTLVALIIEKIPFFVCALFSAIIAIYAQGKVGAVVTLSLYSFPLRCKNALVAYVTYIGKTLWPYKLAVYYPFSQFIPLWQVIGSLLILLVVSVLVLRTRNRSPYLVLGWFWFLVTLLPVIGLIQVGDQSMADRYTYIPLTGLFIMVAWGFPDLIKSLPYRQLLVALLAGAVIITSAAITWRQLGYWQDNSTLYRHTLRVTTGNHVINYNMGLALQAKGDPDGAIQYYREALRTNFFDPGTHNNLGLVLQAKGDLYSAFQEYQAALRIDPNYKNAHINLGAVLQANGNLDAAIQEYQRALRISPDDTDAHYNLGVALQAKGDLDAAIREYREVLRIDPAHMKAFSNQGIVLAMKGDLDGAIRLFQEALKISPNDITAGSNLRFALDQKRNQEKGGR